MTSPSSRLDKLGIALPAVATPAGSYVPARRTGSLVFTAGQVPFVDGSLAATGKVGAAVSAEEAKGLAGICALNALAAVDALVGIDSVVGVVKVVVFVASAPGFDPFGGAGTTGLVADRLGRDAVLIELNPDYAKMAGRRVTDDAPLFADVPGLDRVIVMEKQKSGGHWFAGPGSSPASPRFRS